MDANSFESPQDAFRRAADLARAEGEEQRKIAMSQERRDRNHPEIGHYDYAAARLELLARNFEVLAFMTEDLQNITPPISQE